MFIDYCNYYECTPNGWIGPFTLDNDNCSDDEDLQCSDLGYEDCMEYDFCEWIITNNFDAGTCVDAEDNNDGPPECVMDCEGIEDVNAEEDPTNFCEWMLPAYESGCTDDCEDDVEIEVDTYLTLCQFCLEFENCDEVFNGGFEAPDLDCLFEDCSFDIPDPDYSSEFCQYWVDTDFSGCIGGCDEEVITFIILLDGVCGICLEFENCDEIFNDEDELEGCYENGEWYWLY